MKILRAPLKKWRETGGREGGSKGREGERPTPCPPSLTLHYMREKSLGHFFKIAGSVVSVQPTTALLLGMLSLSRLGQDL